MKEEDGEASRGAGGLLGTGNFQHFLEFTGPDKSLNDDW